MQDIALILNTGKFREYDAWVRLLTRQSGICTAFAFGASKSRRRFTGCLDSFNIVNFSIEKSRKKDFLQLQETTLIDAIPVRNDWKLQGVATNCIRFIEALGIAPETNEQSFDFITDFLKLLPKYTANANLLPPLFRFKLACIQGYAPSLITCAHCKKPTIGEKFLFSVQDGGILCQACREKSVSLHVQIHLTKETLSFLQDVQAYSPHVWLEEEIHPTIAHQFGQMIDAFTHYHLNLEWHKNRFISI